MPYQSQVPYVEHGVIKPTKQIAAAHGVLEREMILPNFFNKQSIMQFAGSEGDTLTWKLPGALPWREYAFRNDRTDPLIFDSFSEARVTLTVSGRLYSGVRITDEQADFDNLSPSYVVPMQAEAIARGVEQICVRAFNTTEYPVIIGGAEANLFSALLEARRVLNLLNTDTKRTLVVGADFAQALLESERITRAMNAGDRMADNAVTEARLGRVAGFDIVESSVVKPDEAIAFTGDAFTLFTGAPAPAPEILSASRNYKGIAMTWLKDYETERLMQRSVLVTYVGTAPALDFLQKYNEGTKMPERSENAHFVRGVKLTLGGASSLANTDVTEFAGIDTAWTAPVGTTK